VIKDLAASLPEIDPAMVLGIGATQIRVAFTASQIPAVLDAYMSGLRAVFAIAVGAYGLATLIGMLGDWRKVDAKELQKASGGGA
jgi:ABC-type proline/glycine betaine transport system permease subunit